MPAMPRKAPLTVVTLKNGPLSNGATDFLLIIKLMMILMLLVLMIMILLMLIVASSLMIQNFQSPQPVFIFSYASSSTLHPCESVGGS